ncbi:MAG: MBOAT family protein [Acidobacteriota bacterium]|nr:MBOAT family protein [Acidobacteriota bacterium]
MLFTTFPFLIFLLLVLALFYALPRRYRRYLLLAASLLFYMAWNAKFVFLIFGLITVDFFAARWIAVRSGRERRLALLVSLAANIGMLGFFKYANFAREIWAQVFRPGQMPQPLDILLPLGISFHTFQSISYVIDVYRGEQAAVTSYVDYALFVAFFPQLVAGPIVRAREFFHDLWHWRPPNAAEWQRGVAMVMTGFVKKLVFADRFALVADPYFTNPAALPGLLPAWTATVSFALQIFFDFSGYTDIAIGTALLFGFHFPENFRRPYLAASITEFWRRWHMTLSRWLRDYIYIPLGGNRQGEVRTYLNLMITMLLGGLWHGASWNFIIWSGYHGALLAVEKKLQGRGQITGMARIPAIPVTFLLVSIGWVFFRAKTLAAALFVLTQMTALRKDYGLSLLDHWHWGLAIFGLLIAVGEEYGALWTRFTLAPAWARTLAMVAALLAIELFSATDRSIPFVYFQF